MYFSDLGMVFWVFFPPLGLAAGMGVGQWFGVFAQGGRSREHIGVLLVLSLLVSFVDSQRAVGSVIVTAWALAALFALLGNFLRGWQGGASGEQRKATQFSLRQIFILLTLCVIAAGSWRSNFTRDPYLIVVPFVTALCGVGVYSCSRGIASIGEMLEFGLGIGFLACALVGLVVNERVFYLSLPLLIPYCLGVCAAILIDKREASGRKNPPTKL